MQSNGAKNVLCAWIQTSKVAIQTS